MSRHNRWAVILAGGEGARLRPFTRAVSGDDRPKQFCQLIGPQTLLAATRERLVSVAPDERTFVVVTRHHEVFYRHELADMADTHRIEQPVNRGTTVAIATALARIAARDTGAIVGFFPADHHYDHPAVLQHVLDRAYRAAAADPDRVFLIGAEADRAETEYGWIQQGGPLGGPIGRIAGDISAFAVTGFFEKPQIEEAGRLLQRGCLWNTFVLIGHQRAFHALLDAALPGLYEEAQATDARATRVDDRAAWHQLYGSLPSSDFSKDVLTALPGRLGVLSLPGAGWTDLGHPFRVLDVMATRGWTVPEHDRAAS